MQNKILESAEKITKEKSVAKINTLISKLNKLIDISFENELMYASFIKEGAVYVDDKGETRVSDTAMALHKINKSDIASLIKTKMLLEGSSTEGTEIVINIINAKSENNINSDGFIHGYRAPVSANN